MISVSGFSKNYGETLAVQDLSFDVDAGSILGMLGPNGAGKTTTLRAMVGILQPTAGRLSIGGHDIVKDPMRPSSDWPSCRTIRASSTP